MEWRKLSDPRSCGQRGGVGGRGGICPGRGLGGCGPRLGGRRRLGVSTLTRTATLVLAQARVHFWASSERLVHCHRLSPASQAGAYHGAIGQWGGSGGGGGPGGNWSCMDRHGGRGRFLGGLGRLGVSNPDTIATLVLAQARLHFRLALASKAERGRGERGPPRREYGWLSASSCMLRTGSGRLRRLLVDCFVSGRGSFFVSGRGASPGSLRFLMPSLSRSRRLYSGGRTRIAWETGTPSAACNSPRSAPLASQGNSLFSTLGFASTTAQAMKKKSISNLQKLL